VDIARRELVDALVATRGAPEEPFGTYLIGGDERTADVARSVERDVFLEYFGNTEELMAAEYGPYERTSLFLCVVDHRRLVPAGVMRLILPSPAGQKTMTDIERCWGREPNEALTRCGVATEPSRIWDIATLAVASEYRGGGSEGLVSLALYQGAVQCALACDVEVYVAILDTVVLRLIHERMGAPFGTFDGLEPKRYLDSPASLPAYVDLPRFGERVRESEPAIHELLFGGRGIEAAVGPPRWAEEARAVTDRLTPGARVPRH
jgi:hypothetical protein